MSTILVTGGAGFIGVHVCNQLQSRGHEVVVVDDLSGGTKAPQQGRFLYGDVADPILWATMPAVDAVIHLAASFANARSVDHPLLDMRCNIEGTLQASLFARERGVPLIYAGSSSSYGAAETYQDEIRPFFEVDRCRPSTPYALSKHTGEEYAIMLVPAAISLRLFNVFGPGDTPGEYRNAIPNMVAKGLSTRVVTVTGSDSSRDFTPVGMVARVFCEMTERMVNRVPLPRVLNVCSGIERRMLDIANTIATRFSLQVEVKDPRCWDSVPRRVGSNLRLRSRVGDWTKDCQTTFDADLDETLIWLSRQRDTL